MEKRALPYIQAELTRLHANNAQMPADESELEFLKVTQSEDFDLVSCRMRFLEVCSMIWAP